LPYPSIMPRPGHLPIKHDLPIIAMIFQTCSLASSQTLYLTIESTVVGEGKDSPC